MNEEEILEFIMKETKLKDSKLVQDLITKANLDNTSSMQEIKEVMTSEIKRFYILKMIEYVNKHSEKDVFDYNLKEHEILRKIKVLQQYGFEIKLLAKQYNIEVSDLVFYKTWHPEFNNSELIDKVLQSEAYGKLRDICDNTGLSYAFAINFLKKHSELSYNEVVEHYKNLGELKQICDKYNIEFKQVRSYAMRHIGSTIYEIIQQCITNCYFNNRGELIII